MVDLKMPVRRRIPYNDDFHAWSVDQAARLRLEVRVDQMDERMKRIERRLDLVEV